MIRVLIFILIFPLYSISQNVIVVIIDGARYSETFGDPNRTYIPKMDSLSNYGAYIDEFYNDSMTYTSRAVPALWTGSWTEVQDTFYNGSWTQYTLKPSIFEYYRKHKSVTADQCYYILKYISSLWLPSFHQNYGPNYWPTFHSEGFSDLDVLNEALSVLNTYHPQHVWIYFADVDSKGHSGNWNEYTNAIQIADSAVSVIWNFIQNDPVYQNNTYLFVTNDHGRHDNAHGGFQHHGDGCDGCRHIMFLALGPAVKQNLVTTTCRRIPDLSVTIAHILNIIAEYTTGDYLFEIFDSSVGLSETILQKTNKLILTKNYPNPFNSTTTINFFIKNSSHVLIELYSVFGRRLKILQNQRMNTGEYNFKFNLSDLASGVYLYKIQIGDLIHTNKIVLVK